MNYGRDLLKIELQVELPGVYRMRHVALVIGEGNAHLNELEFVNIAPDERVCILVGIVVTLDDKTWKFCVDAHVVVGLHELDDLLELIVQIIGPDLLDARLVLHV